MRFDLGRPDEQDPAIAAHFVQETAERELTRLLGGRDAAERLGEAAEVRETQSGGTFVLATLHDRGPQLGETLGGLVVAEAMGEAQPASASSCPSPGCDRASVSSAARSGATT